MFSCNIFINKYQKENDWHRKVLKIASTEIIYTVSRKLRKEISCKIINGTHIFFTHIFCNFKYDKCWNSFSKLEKVLFSIMFGFIKKNILSRKYNI